MMIPEPWENHEEMDPARRAFYRFHASLMEPWDGPALIAFTDGDVIGAVLDRNGLRPGRYWVTEDGLVVLASEVGVLDIDPADGDPQGPAAAGPDLPGRHRGRPDHRGRGGQGRAGRRASRTRTGCTPGCCTSTTCPTGTGNCPTASELATQQQLFGYTEEELRVVLAPMARTGAEPIGSMGTDTPVAALSDRPRLIFDYFTQLFAQVTNPPLDAIREELVTSLGSTTGPEHNLFDPGPASCRQIVLPYPVISESDLAKIIHINDDGDLPGFAAHVVDGRYRGRGRRPGAAAAAGRDPGRGVRRDRGGRPDHRAVRPRRPASGAAGWQSASAGATPAWPSGRAPGSRSVPDALPDPVPAAHRRGAPPPDQGADPDQGRPVVEAGDVRECHHVALLIGYGAAAVCPYLAIESVQDLARSGALGPVTPRKAAANLIKALGKGVLKIMSKMGVSTVASYTGAQIFEAIGLGTEVIGECFTGTSSPARRRRLRRARRRDGGPGTRGRSRPAATRPAHRRLETGGEYQWRREGEPHLFSPETVFKLQHATRSRPAGHLPRVHPPGGRPGGPADDAARAAAHPRRRRRHAGPPAGQRSTRSSRSPASCSGSPPARCPTARSRPRRTRPWPSR